MEKRKHLSSETKHKTKPTDEKDEKEKPPSPLLHPHPLDGRKRCDPLRVGVFVDSPPCRCPLLDSELYSIILARSIRRRLGNDPFSRCFFFFGSSSWYYFDCPLRRRRLFYVQTIWIDRYRYRYVYIYVPLLSSFSHFINV